MKPLISIIVPTYNSCLFLDECLNSIKNQTYTNIEVIIVDGGSCDASKAIANNYCNNNTNWFFYSCKKGVSHQRNVGIDKSNGEYVFFLDSDDYISNNLIEDLYSSMIAEGLDIITPQITKVFYKCNSIVRTDSGSPIIRKQITKDNFFINEYESYLGGPTKLYKKNIIGTTRFDESISLGEDLLFNYNIACKTPFKFNMSFLSAYYYRFTEQKHSSFYNRMNRSNYRFCPILLDIIKKINNKDNNYYGALGILRIYVDLFIKSYLEKHKLIPFALLKSRIFLFKNTKGKRKYYYIIPLYFYIKRKLVKYRMIRQHK